MTTITTKRSRAGGLTRNRTQSRGRDGGDTGTDGEEGSVGFCARLKTLTDAPKAADRDSYREDDSLSSSHAQSPIIGPLVASSAANSSKASDVSAAKTASGISKAKNAPDPPLRSLSQQHEKAANTFRPSERFMHESDKEEMNSSGPESVLGSPLTSPSPRRPSIELVAVAAAAAPQPTRLNDSYHQGLTRWNSHQSWTPATRGYQTAHSARYPPSDRRKTLYDGIRGRACEREGHRTDAHLPPSRSPPAPPRSL